jgi:hypothetical protein
MPAKPGYCNDIRVVVQDTALSGKSDVINGIFPRINQLKRLDKSKSVRKIISSLYATAQPIVRQPFRKTSRQAFEQDSLFVLML